MIRETGWTLQELEATPENFVWALTQVLSLEGEKAREDDDTDMRRRYPPPPR